MSRIWQLNNRSRNEQIRMHFLRYFGNFDPDLDLHEPIGCLVLKEPIGFLLFHKPIGNLVLHESIGSLGMYEPIGSLVLYTPKTQMNTLVISFFGYVYFTKRQIYSWYHISTRIRMLLTAKGCKAELKSSCGFYLKRGGRVDLELKGLQCEV